MQEAINLEIISPDKIILKTETEEVSVPAFEGQMTILKNHIPLITYLRPGLIEVKIKGTYKKFFVEEGTVEFSKNNLLILSSTALDIKELTNSGREKIIKETQDLLNKNEINDKEKYILSYKIDTLQKIKH